MRALDPEVVDTVWAAIAPRLPLHLENHPLGCHRPRASDRNCFEVMLTRLVKEALRRWLKGEGECLIAHGVGVDRKTARRYIAAAVDLGIDRSGGEEQLATS
jgi:hypothetical protein